MNFKKLDTKAKELVNVYLKDTNYVGSDFSFYGYLSWFDDVEYVEFANALFLRAFFNGELRYFQPLVKGKMSIKEAVKLLPLDSSFFSATEDFKNQMAEGYVACTNRDWAEYIYKTSDFIALVGKRYSAKRNHISKFLKNFTPDMQRYTKDDEIEFKLFEKAWMTGQSFDEERKESAVKERQLLEQQLEASLRGELICDVLRVDGNIVGVAIGEIMSSGNAVILHEKADINFEGVYSYLAHQFALANFSDCPYINRQEDMGVEGLRKSKSSYYPEFLLEKFVLTPISRCKSGFDSEIVRPCQGDSTLHVNTNNKNMESEIVRPCQGDSTLHVNTNNKNMGSEIVRPCHGDSTLHNSFGDRNVDSDMQARIDLIFQLPLEKYSFLPLLPKNFNAAMSFFKCGIASLDNKLHFLNYTDDELQNVLANGYMLGAFCERHLVATCGFSADTENCELAKTCGDTTCRQFYEFSGIMVCKMHRKKGLANLVCKKVIEKAHESLSHATLCAIVQFDNIASLANLKKLGFEEKAEADFEQYKFKYLTLEIN